MIIENDVIKTLMDKMSKIEVQSKDKYELDGRRIPRVTEVTSAMLHEDGLMNWANGLGWKRISYRAFMRDAADKGTYSHLAIEKYLKEGYLNIDELNCPNETVKDVVRSTMEGFLDWWKSLHRNHEKIKVVFLEETMVHKYFGGTCDCLLKVDEDYWLIDFKTSNHMSYNYALQLSAYRFLLRELKNIDISRAMVLRLDKQEHYYETYELDLKYDDSHKSFMDDCEQCFMMLVAAFKTRLYTTKEYHEIFNIPEYKNK